jgi:RHS repeat-associated protein
MSYNTAGQRASYTVVLSGTTTLQELFTYRGDQVGQVTYAGSSLTTLYTDTFLYLGASTPYELIRQYASNVICGGQSTATCKYFYVLDSRGNVLALSHATGTVVDRYSYDVWGLPTIALESVKQPLLYAGYWYDRELAMPNETTGWYWLSVRSYDPVLKRFLQPDPSGMDGLRVTLSLTTVAPLVLQPDPSGMDGLRSYVYVGDDPVDRTDPSGLSGGGRCLLWPAATPKHGDWLVKAEFDVRALASQCLVQGITTFDDLIGETPARETGRTADNVTIPAA